MPTTNPIPQLSFADLILRFKTDCALAHDFVRGDANLDVVGEDGAYPSLAKLIANIQTNIQTTVNTAVENALIGATGFLAKNYTFQSSLIWNVQHPEIPTSNFTVSIVNTAGIEVNAPIQIVNDTEFNILFTDVEEGILNVIYYPIPTP